MNKKVNIGDTYKIIIFALTYGISFYYLKMLSKQNSWLIIIISHIIGFLYVKMCLKIKDSYKNKSIFEINKIVLGNIVGTFINLIFMIIYAFLTIIILWYLIIFLKTNFLEKTPVLFLKIIVLLPLFYIINKNNLVLIKSNNLFINIIFILTITAIIFLFPQIELNNLKPFSEISINNMSYALFAYTAVTFLPTHAILGINDLKFNNFFKCTVKTFLLSISIVLSTYLILGNSIIEIVDFPEFFVLRKIGVLANGTRIDSLIIIGWLLSIYAIAATFLLYIRNYLKVEIKSYKNIFSYFLILLIAFLTTNVFKNVSIGKSFILDYLPYLLFFTLFLLNLIIYTILKVKLKKVSH